MNIGSITKRSTEKQSYAVEFFGRLPPGARLPGATVTLSATTIAADPEDATADVLQSTTGTIVGSQVWVPIKDGESGTSYKIQLLVATEDGGTIMDDDVTMIVSDE